MKKLRLKVGTCLETQCRFFAALVLIVKLCPALL